jgi:hypothetical protein
MLGRCVVEVEVKCKVKCYSILWRIDPLLSSETVNTGRC